MGIPAPREMAKIRRIKAVYLGLVVSIVLGQVFLMQDIMDAYNKIEDADRPVTRYDKTLGRFQMLMDMYEDGVNQSHLLEGLCEQGYAPGCLARGLTALNPKWKDEYDPVLNRKQAEEFFQKGCQGEEFPVCRLIAETRRDDGTRDLRDEERVVTGLLMQSCDLGAFKACGDAAQRFFEKGDYRMARSYGTKGCAMKNWDGKPFKDPRSCDYRWLALEKLARENAVPADPGEPAPAAPEPITAKE